MSATPLDLFFGWAALLSAAATLGALITSILFLAVDRAFGKASEAVNAAQMLLMLPVAIAMTLLSTQGACHAY
jgi:hypothetical protein